MPRHAQTWIVIMGGLLVSEGPKALAQELLPKPAAEPAVVERIVKISGSSTKATSADGPLILSEPKPTETHVVAAEEVLPFDVEVSSVGRTRVRVTKAHTGWLAEDLAEFPSQMLGDTFSLVNCKSLLILTGGAGLAVAAHNEWDDNVAAYTAEHPQRWGSVFNDTFAVLGNPGLQFGVAAGSYVASLISADQCLHDFSKAAINSLLFTDSVTYGLQWSFDLAGPDGGSRSFPSMNTASSFALAACVGEFYGWCWGLPAYTMAGLVGWQRIDNRDDNLSDVIFGATLGYVVGKAFSHNHLCQECGIRIAPWFLPDNSSHGVAIERTY